MKIFYFSVTKIYEIGLYVFSQPIYNKYASIRVAEVSPLTPKASLSATL